MQDLIQTSGWVLIHFLWQGSVLGALAWLGCLHLKWKCSSSNTRYLFLCSILLMCGLCPALTWLLLGHLHSFQPLSLVTLPASEVQAIGSAHRISDKAVADFQITCGTLSGPALNYVSISETFRRWIPILSQLWAVGVFVLTLRLTFDCFRISRFTTAGNSTIDEEYIKHLALLAKRMGVRKAVLLVESALVEIPTVLGWLRPILIVPVTFFTSLPPDQIEAILAHELAHVRRYDYFVNLFQIVIETALFYHPAIWWISRSIREERENCCDDIAISVVGNKITYVSALATFERDRSLPSNAALAVNGGSLLKRVQRVFGVCESDSFSLTSLLRESYKGTVLGVLLTGIVCAACFATNRGSITRHVDRAYLAKALVAVAQDDKLSELETLLAQGADPDANVRPTGNNALFTAVSNNQIGAIKLILRYGGHIESKNATGQRAIDWALAKGNLAMATFLRENGAAISPAAWAGAMGDLNKLRSLVADGTLKKGATDKAMKDAVSMGHLDAVKFLERIEGKPVTGRFLAIAASSGNIPMMAYILRQGANIKTDGERAMDQAVIFYDQPEAAKFLLSQGTNPNRFTRWNRFILSQAKSAKMIKVLLEAGANPNCEDMLGAPLSTAPDADSVRLLVQYGAKINRFTDGGSSIIEESIIRGCGDRPDVIEELVKQGAKLDPKSNGVCALAMAAQRSAVKTVKYLLDAGVNPNTYTDEIHLKTSPLRVATIVSSLDVVKLLLEHGGIASGDPSGGQTPLSLALLTGDWDITNLLRKAGARDVCDLSVAAAFGNLNEVSDQIEHGANVNEIDKDGCTPLFYAMQRGRSDVVRLLLRHGAIANDATLKKT